MYVGIDDLPASTTSIASMMRDSSPPLAPLLMGSAVAPACGIRRKPTSSLPKVEQSTPREMVSLPLPERPPTTIPSEISAIETTIDAPGIAR